MTMTDIRVQRVATPLPATDETIGGWLWALEDTRSRTKQMVTGCSQEWLDTLPSGQFNSIGTLLYHIALIEADYLSIDVLGRETYLDPLPALFPVPDRDEGGRLNIVSGVPIAEHLARLETVRSNLLDVFISMTLEKFNAPRFLPAYNYSISPAWTLHHLMQHEAEHRGEIGFLIALLSMSS